METEHDTSDREESRGDAIVPETTAFQSDHSESSTETPASSSAPKIILRPSSLAAQTEKLKFVSSFGGMKCTDSLFCQKSNDEPKKDDGDSSGGNASTTGHTTTSFTDTVSLKHSQSSSAPESSFGLFSKNPFQNESSTGGFVFGQNLHERASNYESVKTEKPFAIESKTCLSFESLQKEEEEEKAKEESEQNANRKRILSDAAKEYESKKVKTVLEKISVVTGEEKESNVLQMNCKLYAFDNEKKNWQERSRGMLRLNDSEIDGAHQSRVVMRTQGSLRVALNTKVWAGMTVEHASEKTIRLTAIDADGVKVFLVMSTAKDASMLFSALKCRITSLKSKENSSTCDEKEPSDESNVLCSSNCEATKGTNSNDTDSDDSGEFKNDVMGFCLS